VSGAKKNNPKFSKVKTPTGNVTAISAIKLSVIKKKKKRKKKAI
jgi:hypothetical protein